MDEKILIQKCQHGEPSAQRALYDKYYGYVYKVVYRYVNHHQDAEDVVSIVFNKIFRNIIKVEDPSNSGLKRWIQTIAINESLRFIQKKNPVFFTDDDSILDSTLQIEYLDEDSNVDYIHKIIDGMPRGYRLIFLLNVVEGLSHSEIADHLNVSKNTSKSQLLKARKYLQSALKTYER